MPRARPPLTRAALVEHANRYLSQYAPTTAHLRRVLMRGVDKSLRVEEPDAEARAEQRERWQLEVDALVARIVSAGIVDDAVWARAKTRSLRERGRSTRAIRSRLRDKGIPSDLIDEVAPPDASADLTAAARYARKRRLGPYLEPAERRDRRQRDLASLGRAGFTFDIARRIVDAEDVEQLRAWADPQG